MKLTQADLDWADRQRDVRDQMANVVLLHALRRQGCAGNCWQGRRPCDCRERQEQIEQSEAPAPLPRPYPIQRAIFGPYRRTWWRRLVDRLLED